MRCRIKCGTILHNIENNISTNNAVVMPLQVSDNEKMNKRSSRAKRYKRSNSSTNKGENAFIECILLFFMFY